MKKIAIIGSGIAGIACSIRLAAKGFKVDVYESNDYPGGKLDIIESKGFRFDAGPSLFTLPNLVQDCLKLAGKEHFNSFEFIKLDRACEYFYEDGIHLTAWSDHQKFSKEVQNKLGIKGEIVSKHLEHSAFLYETTHRIFLERSLHKLKNYFNKDVINALVQVFSLDLNSSMHRINEKKLRDEKLVQLFDRFATYNGSNPYKAPGILNIIPHLEHNIGTFFPKKGMYSIIESLYEASKSLGVKYYFGNKVTSINCEKKTAKGIKVNQRDIDYDIVVSNSDVFPTYKNLLKDQKQPQKILSQERSSSALIFYWGINKTFEKLDLHNILFSNDYKEEFKYLFVKGKIYHDPTVYINISSKYKADDAPEGKENWFVMINAPANSGQNWKELVATARNNIIEKINRILSIDIEEIIETEEILDPVKIENKTSSYQGSLYGTSSNTKLAAFLRHPNFSQKIKNLYFCGGSVHPGGGIPLCLLSAKIVSELIDEK